jgi:predicted transcriptional regulator
MSRAYTVHETAEILGITSDAVRQIERRAYPIEDVEYFELVPVE